MPPTAVMIIDDHAVLRSGLRLLIDAQEDMKVVAETGSIDEAMAQAGQVAVDVVTLDISMPGTRGLEGLSSIRGAYPRARVLLLTMHDEESLVRSAIALGAAGYVCKSVADSQLIGAIRSIAAGGMAIECGGALAKPSAVGLKSRPDAVPAETLSDQERAVLDAIAHGFTNREIGERMKLSIKTVESYRARLMKKLGLRSRADLMRFAIERGVLQTPLP